MPDGVATTHGLMSTGNWAEQVPCGGLEGSTFVQTIPAGEVVTSPVPVPANVMVSVHVPLADDDAKASADAPTMTSTQTTRNTRKTVIVSCLALYVASDTSRLPVSQSLGRERPAVGQCPYA